MPRNSYAILLAIVIVVIVGGAFLYYSYRTPEMPEAAPTMELAEPGEQVAPATSTEGTATFGGVSLRIDYATTVEAREWGLGGRESLAPDEAMLFVFPNDDYWGFWMNDMLIPIDIFWLNAQGQVVSISQNVVPETYPDVFYPTAPARYVLETIAGFARAHSITTGTPLLLKNFPSVTE